MGCLYCGKDIGPFRLFRDDEFCSAAHRKMYGQRLGKVLDRIGAPELVPTRVPGVRELWPIQDGSHDRISGCWTLESTDHPVQTGDLWPFALHPTLGSCARALAPAAPLVPNRPLQLVNRPPDPIATPLMLPQLPESLRGTSPTVSPGVARDTQLGVAPRDSRPKSRIVPMLSRRGSKRFTSVPLQLPEFDKSLRADPDANLNVVPLPANARVSIDLNVVEHPPRPALPIIEGRMPGLVPEAVERQVMPSLAGPLQSPILPLLPTWARFDAPKVERTAGTAPASVEPAIAAAAPSFTEESAASSSVSLPGLKHFFPLPDFLGGAPDPWRSFDLEFLEPYSTCRAFPGLPATPVQSWVQPSDALSAIAPAPELRIPTFELAHAAATPEICAAVAGPAPSPVQRFIAWSDALNAVTSSPVLRLPEFAVAPENPFDFETLVASGTCPAVAGPAPSPVQTFIVWSDAVSAIAPAFSLRLPEFERAQLEPENPFNFDTLVAVGTCPAQTGPAPSPVQRFIAWSDALQAIAPTPVLQLPSLGKSFEVAFPAGRLATSDAFPSPVASLLPPKSFYPVGVEGPAVQLPAMAAFAERPLADLQENEGLVAKEALEAPFAFNRAHSGPTLPSPVASFLPFPKAPEPVQFNLEPAAILLPQIAGLDSVVANSISKSCPTVASPVPTLLPAAAAEATEAVTVCPTWPTPVQAFLSVASALTPMEISEARTEIELPKPPALAQSFFSPAQPGTRPMWPLAATLPTRTTAADQIVAETGAPVQLPPAAGVFVTPSVLAASKSVPAFADPAEPPVAAGFVPQPMTPASQEMFLSLPHAGTPVSGARIGVGPAAGPAAYPVESLPAIAAFAPFRIAGSPTMQFPPVLLPKRAGLEAASSGQTYPAAATPEPRQTNDKAAVLKPLTPLKVAGLSLNASGREPAVPHPGFIPVEFHCQRGQVFPHRRLELYTPTAVPILPGFGLKTVVDRIEDIAVWNPTKAEESEEVKKVELAKRRAREVTIGRFLKIAACLVMGTFLWFGAREARIGATRSIGNQDAARAGASKGGASKEKGLLASVQTAINDRAAYSVTDTMANGMQSWGAAPKSYPAGWSHNPDGYTHTGELALFKPSLNYKDYRLEFFGQIENRSLGWTIRSQDKQNYYAMKLTVLENGLRPVIAMAHYPVVGGKKGHKVESPLSVMIHHNTPFHVAVDVQGNRVTASVEGQQVDSWTDDLLPKGGVGFFAEAGERGRLYWMKVSKNQDWLGTICSYLSSDAGTSSRDTAEVWGPGIPGQTPEPTVPAQPHDVLLAEAEINTSSFSNPQRVRIGIERRNRPWSL